MKDSTAAIIYWICMLIIPIWMYIREGNSALGDIFKWLAYAISIFLFVVLITYLMKRAYKNNNKKQVEEKFW